MPSEEPSEENDCTKSGGNWDDGLCYKSDTNITEDELNQRIKNLKPELDKKEKEKQRKQALTAEMNQVENDLQKECENSGGNWEEGLCYEGGGLSSYRVKTGKKSRRKRKRPRQKRRNTKRRNTKQRRNKRKTKTRSRR